MTDKQKKFVLEYMIDMNATQAAIRSGYSLRTAYSHGQRLLKNVEIQKAISEIREERQRESILTILDIEQFLSETIKGEHEEEVVTTIGDGEGVSHAEIVKKQVSMRDRLKAAELLGKRYGLFTDKQQVTVQVPIFEGDDELED